MTPAAHNIRIWMRVNQIKHAALDAASKSRVKPDSGDHQKFWLGEIANAVRELMQANNDARFRRLLARYFMLQALKINPQSAVRCLTRERLH
jgi:hypothetical protein